MRVWTCTCLTSRGSVLGPVVGGVGVDLPAHRLVGDVEGLEHLGVEPVLAGEALRHVGEEEARLRPLDDAVVVGGGEGHGLADAELGHRTGVGGLEARRVGEGSDPDDDPLSRHQPRHRLDRPERAGVGEGHRRPVEVVGGDAVGVDLAHQLLVGGHESPEVQRVGVGDARDEQGAAAVRLLHVDGQTEAHVAVRHHAGRPLAVGIGHERGVEGGHRTQPLDHRVADEVGEADLGAGGAEQLVVDDGAVDLEELGRHDPDARGGGDARATPPCWPPPGRRRPAAAAPGRDRRRRPAGRDRPSVQGWSRRAPVTGVRARRAPERRELRAAVGRRRRAGWQRQAGRCRGRAGRTVVGEEFAPRVGHRGRVGEIALVHVLDQPGIGPEGTCSGRHPRPVGLRRAVAVVAVQHRRPAYWGGHRAIGARARGHGTRWRGRRPTWEAVAAMTGPTDLAVTEHRPREDAREPIVVLVHGSLDRSTSFARVVRRLHDLPTVTYDRRGYHHSRHALPLDGGPSGHVLSGHVDDLFAVIAGRPAVVVGHSYGADVALAAALRPGAPDAVLAVAAYEPPVPWLEVYRSAADPSRNGAPVDLDPGDPEAAGLAAERFFRRMVGDAAWERLPEPAKAARRADGPALAAELRSLRLTGPPFDIAAMPVPVTYGRGECSAARHRQSVAWLHERTPGSELVEIAGASHGAHLTHPDAFAAMVRSAVARAHRPAGRRPVKVLLAGGSGLIGTALADHLRGGGDQVVRLVRGPGTAPASARGSGGLGPRRRVRRPRGARASRALRRCGQPGGSRDRRSAVVPGAPPSSSGRAGSARPGCWSTPSAGSRPRHRPWSTPRPSGSTATAATSCSPRAPGPGPASSPTCAGRGSRRRSPPPTAASGRCCSDRGSCWPARAGCCRDWSRCSGSGWAPAPARATSTAAGSPSTTRSGSSPAASRTGALPGRSTQCPRSGHRRPTGQGHRCRRRPAGGPRRPRPRLRLALGAEMADEFVLGGQRARPAVLAARGFEFAHPEIGGAVGVRRSAGAERSGGPRLPCRRRAQVRYQQKGLVMTDAPTKQRGGGATTETIDPDRFEHEARAFLDAHAPRRPPERFVWGEGSDKVGLLPERTPEQERGRPRRRPVLGPDVFDAGFGWITGPGRSTGAGSCPASTSASTTAVAADYKTPSLAVFGIGLGMVAPTILAHATDEVKAGLPAQDAPRRHRGLPALQRAGRRLGPRLAPDPGGAGRRRVGHHRSEGVDLGCAALRHRGDHLPDRPRPPQAPGPHRVRGRHARPGRRGPPAPSDDRRRVVQRGVLHRRPGARLPPPGRGQRRLDASRSPPS